MSQVFVSPFLLEHCCFLPQLKEPHCCLTSLALMPLLY